MFFANDRDTRTQVWLILIPSSLSFISLLQLGLASAYLTNVGSNWLDLMVSKHIEARCGKVIIWRGLGSGEEDRSEM